MKAMLTEKQCIMSLYGYGDGSTKPRQRRFPVLKKNGKNYLDVHGRHIKGFDSEYKAIGKDSYPKNPVKANDCEMVEISVGDYILIIDTRTSEEIDEDLIFPLNMVAVGGRNYECYRVLNFNKKSALAIHVRVEMAPTGQLIIVD